MRDTLPATRRQVLLGGTAAVTGTLAGCAGQGGDQFSESDALLTHERWGRGETALTYRTSSFYTPIAAAGWSLSAAIGV